MKRFAAFLLLLLPACQTPYQAAEDDQTGYGTFGTPAGDEQDRTSGDSMGTGKVAEFRGIEMPRLLAWLDGEDRDRWLQVRRYVHPAPQPPVLIQNNRVVRRNYDWPAADPAKMSDAQKAWHAYLLWPKHVRQLLQAEGPDPEDRWDSLANRTRLARLGRIYSTVYRFQTAPAYRLEQQEAQHWREFAETMMAYGEDGRDMLISNMILALTNPEQRIVFNAQNILVQIGAPAIERLCAVLWTGHNQLVEVSNDEGEISYKVETNANFPRYVVECLFRIGPRSANQAIYELKNGPVAGTAWRFRKNFVDLLGQFKNSKDPQSVRALEEELSRVQIEELDRQAAARGEHVIDETATDQAAFVYREYLVQALGNIGLAEGLRPIIRIWEMDEEFHLNSAADAVLKISGRRVRTIAEAKAVATRLGVDLTPREPEADQPNEQAE